MSWTKVIATCLASAWLAGASLANAAEPADSSSAGRLVPRAFSAAEWSSLQLGRAVDCWFKHDLRGAAALLETVDVSVTSPFVDADRAAFLLAAAYLALDDDDAFARVAARAGDANGSTYRKWIRYCDLAQRSTLGAPPSSTPLAAPDFAGAVEMSASLLLESGRAAEALALLEQSQPSSALASVHLYLQALARRASGGDAARDWERLASLAPRNALESDLVGAALIQLAAVRVEQNRDAGELLRRVPAGSRYGADAAEMMASIATEKGDTAAARGLLSSTLGRGTTSPRGVKLALADLALDRSYWHAALRYAESAEDGWIDEHEALSYLEANAGSTDAWTVWEDPSRWTDEIRLASDAILAHVAAMASASLDLRTKPALEPATSFGETVWPSGRVHAVAWDSTAALQRHAPSTDDWARVSTAAAAHRSAQHALAQHELRIVEMRAETERQLAYLRDGRAQASASEAELARAAASLDSLLVRMGAALRQLELARDAAKRQVSERSATMLRDLERDAIFSDAVRHFWVDGPQRERPERFPAGFPRTSDVLAGERSLVDEARTYVSFFGRRATELIDSSYAQVWRPRLADDSHVLRAELGAELWKSRHIVAVLDSTIAAVQKNEVLARAIARRDILAGRADSLAMAERQVRADVARDVAQRGRARLEGEREAIDYRLIDASYELAVDAAFTTEPNADSLAITPLRARAVARLRDFLQRYPNSVARGETRFRLADLELMHARDEFQAKMKSFLGQSPSADQMSNRAMAPFVDYAPAVALYRSILAEDPGFPHRDAVLFNLGMILSDDGQPEAAEHLTQLVQRYPNSPDAQEAWLRLGSDHFDREDYAGCAPFFVEAARGANASHTAIALYKLGWAHFEEDRFDEATDAFRRLIDHYAQHADIAQRMDLRDEAEEYLVHSLARAGGAPAFKDYFATLGSRDYESRVLLALGHLMRSHSLYEEAVACDQLWLERYPQSADAMDVVDRMAETYKSWNKPDAAREAKLSAAARLLPGSAWWKANNDEALHLRAQSFAQGAYRESAAHQHTQARQTNDPASWKAALDTYETYLKHWPAATDADRIHFVAGEAAARLNDYRSSLAHFATAAKSDSAGLAAEAAWQHVAVTDTWYTRVQSSGATARTDSLGTILLSSCKDFTRRYPADPRCADVVWRGGHVAYAHGWYEDASTALLLFGDRFPADARAPKAVRMAGDARYQRGEFDQAGAAYEKALGLARTAKQDTLATSLSKAIPVCYFKHAEAVAKDKGNDDAAPLFARIARDWPSFPHADLALYRSGLGYAEKQSYADAAAQWEQLLIAYPKSEYARDATVQIAQAHEKSGNARAAADAYERFSRTYASDPDAPEALLKASELLAAAKDDAGADRMRSLFIERFPGETETVMQIRADRAQKELAGVTSGTGKLSALFSAPAKKGAKAAPPASDLQAYLNLAKEHPELASPAILAQVDYLTAEEAHADYAAMKLTQPLPKSLEKKKAKLESTLALYNKCSSHGDAQYTRAAAHRVGQSLIEFGDALVASERPQDLSGDDLLAYDDVLSQQSWEFYDRGEDVWSDLLTQTRGEKDDPGGWIARTRDALWPRLGQKFLFQPSAQHPLVAAKPPAQTGSK